MPDSTIDTTFPPGPDLPAAQLLSQMRDRPREFTLECARKYGKAFTLRFSDSPPVVVVSSAQGARELLTLNEEESFQEIGENQLFFALMGQRSLLFLRGGAHKRMRDMLIKPFGSDRLDRYAEMLNGVAQEMVAQFPRGRPISIYEACEDVEWNCIVRLVLGTPDRARIDPVVKQLSQIRLFAIRHVFKLLRPDGRIRLSGLQEALGPLTPWGRFLKKLERLNAQFNVEIERVRGEPENQGLLSMILKARDSNGQPMTDEEVRDSLVAFISGGVETVASTSVQLLYRLLQHPEAMRKVVEEISAPTPHPRFSYAHLKELTYLDWAVKESMRLDPAFCQLRRTLKVTKQIDGVSIPANTQVLLSTYSIHHDEAIWPDADAFKPERFATARPGPFDMLQFGAGPHRCPGGSIGIIEVKQVLGHLLSACEVATPPGFVGKIIPDGPVWAVTDGLPLILRDRSAPAETVARAAAQ